MGKARITENLGDGKYKVLPVYAEATKGKARAVGGKQAAQAEAERLSGIISSLQEWIAKTLAILPVLTEIKIRKAPLAHAISANEQIEKRNGIKESINGQEYELDQLVRPENTATKLRDNYAEYSSLDPSSSEAKALDNDYMKILDEYIAAYDELSTESEEAHAELLHAKLMHKILTGQVSRHEQEIEEYERQETVEIEAWVTDYTDDLDIDTEVGTIEIGGTGVEYRDGERKELHIIKPGFADEELERTGAGFVADDGTVQLAEESSPSGFFWNAAMQPAWQRWRPTFRTGVILSIDYEEDEADVCLRPATSYNVAISMPLEPDTLERCDLGESEEEDENGDEEEDYHIQQAQDFCERHGSHPFCQDFEARETISYDTWWPTIVAVNTQVNTNVTYARDVGGDVWSIATSGTGDCEDYALGKMHLMAGAGIPAGAMGLAIGKLGSGPVRGMRDVDHAWAVVFTDKGMFHLDQVPNVPLGTQPGSNFQILRYNRYEILARKLTSVPIEYMDCNSVPFMEGDDVVVKFDDQDWSKPKIIGFVEKPRPCDTFFIRVDWGHQTVIWNLREEEPAEFPDFEITKECWPLTTEWVDENLDGVFYTGNSGRLEFEVIPRVTSGIWSTYDSKPHGDSLCVPGINLSNEEINDSITQPETGEEYYFNYTASVSGGTFQGGGSSSATKELFWLSNHLRKYKVKGFDSYGGEFYDYRNVLEQSEGSLSTVWTGGSSSSCVSCNQRREQVIEYNQQLIILEKNEIEYEHKDTTYSILTTRNCGGQTLRETSWTGPRLRSHYHAYDYAVFAAEGFPEIRQGAVFGAASPWNTSSVYEQAPPDFYIFLDVFSNEMKEGEYVPIGEGEEAYPVPEGIDPFALKEQERLTELEAYLSETWEDNPRGLQTPGDVNSPTLFRVNLMIMKTQ